MRKDCEDMRKLAKNYAELIREFTDWRGKKLKNFHSGTFHSGTFRHKIPPKGIEPSDDGAVFDDSDRTNNKILNLLNKTFGNRYPYR